VLRLVREDEEADDRGGGAQASSATQAAPPGEQTVTYTGRLAFVTHEEFVNLVEQAGAHFVPTAGPSTSAIVVGQQDWALRSDGTLPPALGKPDPRTLVVSEERFLSVLGIEPEDRREPQLYTTATLGELLGISRERLRAWVNAGLIRPARHEQGIMRFDFRQVSIAKMLWEISQAGVPLAQVRRSLQQLRAWMPDVDQPLDQLAVLEQCGRLLVRLEEGLAQPDGQFHFDFTGEPPPEPAPPPCLTIGPRTAVDWMAQARQQEHGGYLEEAADSYRQCLMKGGPDREACYNLAHVLAQLGYKYQALERYRQAIEIDPRFGDAWNNLGILLAEMGEREEACIAFRRVLAIDSQHLRAHYNLADTLDELGRLAEAREHWQAYVRLDPMSDWGKYARSRLV
jgi:tetratricopeptide (TPR) repeat protein